MLNQTSANICQSFRILCPRLSEIFSSSIRLSYWFKFLKMLGFLLRKEGSTGKTPPNEIENFLMTLFDLNQTWNIMFTDCTHFRKVCERLWRYEWHQNITRNDLFTLKIDGKVYHAMSKYQAYWIWPEDFDISFCVAFDHWCQRFLWRGDWALGSASIHSWNFP